MHPHIPDWIRAYLALLEHAGELRGFVESRDDSRERWPRTSGIDVILIAALVDPCARACGESPSARRWRTGMLPMASTAAVAPHAEYADSRLFWQMLADACVDMHAADVPIPLPAMWRGLFDELARATHRNANALPITDAPFGPIANVTDAGEIQRSQFLAAVKQRGFDVMDAPPDHRFGGNGMKIPRTTNTDAIALADYWSKLFGQLPHEIQGVDYVGSKWAGIVADVNALARSGKPDEPYAKNNALWRELPNVAGKVNEWMNQPDKVALFQESLIESVKSLPERLSAAGKALAHGAEEAASAVAHAAGKVVNEGAKGAFSGFGVPLLVGAGVIGLFLIARARKGDDHEAS